MCFQWTNRWCRALLNTTMWNAKTKVWTVTRCVMISWTSLTCWMTFFWTEVSCLCDDTTYTSCMMLTGCHHCQYLKSLSNIYVRNCVFLPYWAWRLSFVIKILPHQSMMEILYLIFHSSSPNSAALFLPHLKVPIKNDCEPVLFSVLSGFTL